MPSSYPRDRFDEIPRTSGRVGAHRAENPGMSTAAMLLWAAVATVVLVIVGIVVFLQLSHQSTAPTTSTQPSAVQTTDPVVDTSYSVLILNGTATEGLDDEVADQLAAAGFAEDALSTADSETTDFEATTVFYAAPEDEPAARGLAEAIGTTEVAESTTYSGEGEKQLTVVVGLDRAAAR
jgi:hypothetical protein